MSVVITRWTGPREWPIKRRPTSTPASRLPRTPLVLPPSSPCPLPTHAHGGGGEPPPPPPHSRRLSDLRERRDGSANAYAMPRALVLSLPRSAAAGGITALMSGAGSGDWGGCCPCEGEKRGKAVHLPCWLSRIHAVFTTWHRALL